VQARSPEQETAPSEPPGTFGLGWIDQPVPFHSSITGVLVPELEDELPTAKQTFRHGQETPLSAVTLAASGLGVICQPAPSQRSANPALLGGVKALPTPTAMHESADEQSTALRSVNEAPDTFGVGVTVQAADAVEGASSSARVATRERTNGRGGKCLNATRREPTPPVAP
jgi:hypothetical protein